MFMIRLWQLWLEILWSLENPQIRQTSDLSTNFGRIIIIVISIHLGHDYQIQILDIFTILYFCIHGEETEEYLDEGAPPLYHFILAWLYFIWIVSFHSNWCRCENSRTEHKQEISKISDLEDCPHFFSFLNHCTIIITTSIGKLYIVAESLG